MKKNDLVTLLNDTLSPNGFRPKGNNWVNNDGEISKIVNLQKSEFSDSYYINYGYAIKQLPLAKAKMHIYLRLFSAGDDGKADTVGELLKLGNDIPDLKRRERLIEIINQVLIPALRATNHESDIKEKITDGTWRNIAPVTVKRYFGIESA